MRKMRVDGPYDLVVVVAHALYLLVKLVQTGHISAQGRVDTHHAKLFGEDSFNDKPAAVVFQSGLRKHPAEADIVIGVPDSGNAAAMGFALESNIPYGVGFIKNSYVGRTFIKPKQSARESSVNIKLNALKEVVSGKRVVMVDDSIVRGTTSGHIVKMLKDAGATEVHVRISSPPFLFPCYFGTDVPSCDQLIAHDHTVSQICELIGADSLGYLDGERLPELIEGETGYCDACFSGNYPVEPPTEDIRGSFEP